MLGINEKKITSMQIFFAKKKSTGGSSLGNGRDSAGRRLGNKVGNNQRVFPGEILVVQRGTQKLAGQNVKMGNNHTLNAKIEGRVIFSTIRGKTVVSVFPEPK